METKAAATTRLLVLAVNIGMHILVCNVLGGSSQKRLLSAIQLGLVVVGASCLLC